MDALLLPLHNRIPHVDLQYAKILRSSSDPCCEVLFKNRKRSY